MKKISLSFIIIAFINSLSISQNLWQQTTCPSGGPVLSLAININGQIFAAVYGVGIYTSTDNGNNWKQINNGLTSIYVEALAINSTGHVFAGTYGGGVFRSTDNGNSWTQINNGLIMNGVKSLAINSAGDIFAGSYAGVVTNTGIYRSTNNGNNWVQINNGLTINNYNSFNTFAFNSTGNTFVGGGGVYRSTDNGNNWTLVGLPNNNTSTLLINSAGYIYAGTWGGGILCSTNNGNNWLQTVMNIQDVRILAINSKEQIFAGTYGNGVYFTTDSGISWTQINNGLTTNNVVSFILNSTGNLFAGTSDAGIFKNIFSTTSIDYKSTTPTKFALYQNYPNPFNPETTISFNLQEANFVTLKIYDMLGREIETLIHEFKQQGNYVETFSALSDKHRMSLPSGIYFYKLQAGNYSQTKKMILLK